MSAAGTVARLRMRVADHRPVARDVVVLDLAPVDGGALPEWEPGAHVDLEIAPGTERQYSLVATTPDGHWRVAVLREASGRGGSVAVHDALAVGHEVVVGGPRNHFGFDPGRPAVFVAGGIGITPIAAMIAAAEAAGTPWELHYAGAAATAWPSPTTSSPRTVSASGSPSPTRGSASTWRRSSRHRPRPSSTAADRAGSWTPSSRQPHTGRTGASGSSASRRPRGSTHRGRRSRRN